jgi:hypothetical protein
VLLVCTAYSVLYSETALSWKPFGIGRMYIYISLLRMTDTISSQNIDLSPWETLYIVTCRFVRVMRMRGSSSDDWIY